MKQTQAINGFETNYRECAEDFKRRGEWGRQQPGVACAQRGGGEWKRSCNVTCGDVADTLGHLSDTWSVATAP